MNDILLALHLIGLMVGSGGGIGSATVMPIAAKAPPEQAAVLRALGPRFARISMIGLVLMWVTGVAMVALTYPLASMPTTFWVKIAFVLSLTVCAILVHVTYAQVKKRDAAAANRLPVLGPISGASAFLAAIAAVFTFH